MKTKEKISILINIHTRVVTGVFFFLCLYLFWLPGDAKIRVIDILGIQIIGFISAVANIPFLVEKEYSKPAMAVLNAVYFVIINVSVLIMGYVLHWFSFKKKSSVVAIEIMIIAVYVLTKFIFYMIDFSSASKITKKLQERNRNAQED